MAGINTIQTVRTGMYNHNFSYENILSGQMGRLIPVQCDEVNAGERWNENVQFVMRMSPLIHPAMVRMNVQFYSFFVPYRIITPRNSTESTWEKFICKVGESSQVEGVPGANIPHLPAVMTSQPVEGSAMTDDFRQKLKDWFGVGSLSDYLDVLALTPQDIDKATHFEIPEDFKLSLMGHLAYLSIYNNWFRRDQIEEEILSPLSLGNVDLSNLALSEYSAPEEWERQETLQFNSFVNDELFKLRYKNYERDYFTSALKEPQYGQDVMLGGGSVNFEMATDKIEELGINSIFHAPVTLADFYLRRASTVTNSNAFVTLAQDGYVNSSPFSYNGEFYGADSVGTRQPFNIRSAKTTPLDGDNYADMHYFYDNLRGTANDFTINEFRLAMQLQALREVINRGGTRYIEIMANVYNSLVPDARLQQPVYLGGFKAPIQIGTVVQTSETEGSSALGSLAGKAQAANGGKLFRSKKKFDEAGLVMTIMCVTPRAGYATGVPRKWRKFDPIDFFNPMFAHLGEQTIKSGELHFNPLGSYETPTLDFGYQERYSEYRHALSRVHGEMRTTKNAWHLFRYFDSNPLLDVDFIKQDVKDFTRIFQYEEIADTSDEMFDMEIYFDIRKKSPVPKYGTPYHFI